MRLLCEKTARSRQCCQGNDKDEPLETQWLFRGGVRGSLIQKCGKDRRLNNTLIIGHLRDTDIRQCIYDHTNLIYCVNSYIG